MKVIIIGAGPAGLTAAYELKKNGIDVLILESSEFVGGMSRSLDMFGQRVDCGPHRFFSSDKIVNALFHEVLDGDFTMVNRLTRIYYRDRFFNYPLKIFNVLGNLGIHEIFAVLLSYLAQRLKRKTKLKSFEDWVVAKFGSKLFSIFFKTYSEKLWGISCQKLDADWAAQRIKKLSLIEAVMAAFFRDRGKKHKTLVDQFAYPINGTGTLYEKMAYKIEQMGGEFRFNTKISSVIWKGNFIVGVSDTAGRCFYSEFIVSTMPLNHLIKGFGNAVPEAIIRASKKLYFRNTTLVFLEIDAAKLFPDNWIYIHSPKVQLGRVTNFRNWCPSLNKGLSTTILCCEYWSFDVDDFWSLPEDELERLAHKDLKTIKLLDENHKVLNGKVIKVPNCYPVYEIGYKESLDILIYYLKQFDNLIPIGRYGSFKYNNQDHSILMGILAAKQILTGQNQNLWDINTDTNYQEDTQIKDSGLN